MTTRLVPAKPTIRQQNLKWMNLMIHCHDMMCDCPTPLQHIIVHIFQTEPEIDFKPIEKDLIKRCITGETTTAVGVDHEEDALDAATLEDLFKENTGEEGTTG